MVEITLCCKEKKYCPVLIIQKDKVMIKDDHGGKVELTKEELEKLLEKLQQLKKGGGEVVA